MEPDNHTPERIAAETGRRIAAARKAQKWSQEILATKLGWNKDRTAREQPNAISPTRIASYEQGKRGVTHAVAAKLAFIFDMPKAYFMGVITEHEAHVIHTMRNGRPRPP